MPATTPQRIRLKRSRSASPSGLTPSEKRQATARKGRWSEDEREYLKVCVAEKGLPDVDWNDIASRVNAKFGGGRTDKACASTYKRQRALFADEELSVKPLEVKMCDASVQTVTLDVTEGAIQSSTISCNAGTQTGMTAGPYDPVVFGTANFEMKSNKSITSTKEVGLPHSKLRDLLTSQKEEHLVSHKLGSATQTMGSATQTINPGNNIPEYSLPQKPSGTEKSNVSKGKRKCLQKKKKRKGGQQENEEKGKEMGDHSYVRSAVKKKKRKTPVKRLFKAHARLANALTIPSEENVKRVPLAKMVQLKLLLHIGDCTEVAKAILRSPSLRKEIMKEICEAVGERPEHMRNKKKDFVSVLKETNFDGLESVNFSKVVEEMKSTFPELLQILTYIMLSEEERCNPLATAEIIPKLALIYSIALQTRNHELSLVQRTVSSLLAESTCDRKVYDRLNKLGVCSSYSRSMVVLKQIGSRYMDILVKAAEEEKNIRLIGDNLNFMLGVHQDKQDNHRHMVHMFASAALISEKYFLSKPKVPEIPLNQLTDKHILLSTDEYKMIRDDMVSLVSQVASHALPYLNFLDESIPEYIGSADTENHKTKTEVVPLPVLPFNEQDYKQDVKILDFYEGVALELNRRAGLDKNNKYHIGGDQLTRIRLLYAMILRLGNYIPAECFAHLGPTTFEFFHFCMNYLEKLVFGELWNANGPAEVGTMKGEKERIFRDSVDPKVHKAYDADKEFTRTFVNAYLVEALMEFFGIEKKNDAPTKHAPPVFETKAAQKDWVYQVIGKFVDEFIYPAWSGHDREEHVLERVTTQEAYAVVRLADGTLKKYPTKKERVETLRKVTPDKVKDYGHCVLEVGMTFQYLLCLCKRPDRERMLALSKMMMLQLKTRNNQAKYPLELLRMLVQQYSLLPLQQACQVFQDCFVNTKGRPDSHIPADLQMEWIVKMSKGHIKHLVANKKSDIIEKRSAALPGLQKIAANYDDTAGVVDRAQKHKKEETKKEVEQMMSDLRSLRPFRHEEGRAFASFLHIEKSQLKNFDGYHYRCWFEGHKNFFVA